MKICVTTLCIETNGGSRYIDKCRNLINSHVNFTNYDIIVLTNRFDNLHDLSSDRVKLINYDDRFKDPIVSARLFNMHLKRHSILVAQELGYDIIFYNDCDCFIDGWDHESFTKFCLMDFDVAYVSHVNPQLGELRRSYTHFQDKVINEFGDLYYPELDRSPNPNETRVIFKNNEKLKNFILFWDKISDRNNNYNTYYDGVYFGTSSVHSKMNMKGVTRGVNFTKYCKISHGEKFLNFFGEYL